MRKGVPAKDIILDDQGLTTYETMCNYIRLAKQHNLNSVIIVSQFYHLHRSRAMIKSLGVQNYYTAHSNYFELRDFYSVLREFFAYYVFLVS